MVGQNAKSALEVSDDGVVLQQGGSACPARRPRCSTGPEIGPLFLGGAVRGLG